LLLLLKWHESKVVSLTDDILMSCIWARIFQSGTGLVVKIKQGEDCA